MVIDHGNVEEVGTHKELIDKKGKYYDMLMKQREALKLKGVAGE
jgi:ABC-type multidrug transport system fused ATPase/permease subunit